MIGLLLAMYPARWRVRYEEEFRSLLESRPLGPFDVADVLIGALDARLTRFRFAGAVGIDGGPPVMLRLGGIGAVVGGALWFLGLALASQPGDDDAIWLALMACGSLGLLVALIGLSAFQARVHPRLAWAAFAIPALGVLVSLLGIAAWLVGPNPDALVFGAVSPWAIWMTGLLATLVGAMLFAIATIRAAVLSRRAAQALAASSAVVLLLAGGLVGGGGTTDGLAPWILGLAMGSFGASWMWLGLMALRHGPIRAVAPA
jgi:uncharacterized membrane protein